MPSTTYLDYDAQGFIIGQKQMTDGIDALRDDTQSILKLLEESKRSANARLARMSDTLVRINSNARQSRRVTRQSQEFTRTDSTSSTTRVQPARTPSNHVSQSVQSASIASNTVASDDNLREISALARRPSLVSHAQESTDLPASSEQRRSDAADRIRQRDANGRFLSNDGTDNGDTNNKSIADYIRRLSSGGSVGDVENIDPIVASVNELKDVMSPVRRGAGLAYGAGKMAFSKLKALKRREPLSRAEDTANRRQNKILEGIRKAIRRTGSGIGGSAIGKLLGRGGGMAMGAASAMGGGLLAGGKKLLPMLGKAKILGPIAALASGAGLAMDWDNLDHKGKSAGIGGVGGALAGASAGAALGTMIFPGVGTVIGGALGGWLGSEGGEALGEAASPYIQQWTQSLTNFDLGAKLKENWMYGLNPFFLGLKLLPDGLMSTLKAKLSSMIDGVSNGLGKGGDWISDQYDNIKGKLGFGGNGEPHKVAKKAADFAMKHAASKSLGLCARYVNDAFRDQGFKASGHGKDVADNLIKQNKGKFDKIEYSEDYVPQEGDVMSMPSSSKSKHNYGHAAVYTKEGWVSDFKQGEKRGNTAAPNDQYYKDIQAGTIKPTIARMRNPDAKSRSNAGKSTQGGSKSSQAMAYFEQQGWTKEQAAGIVGNLHKESGNFNEDVISGKRTGDSGKAVGIAQWHPDRQANFAKKFGKSLKGASFEEQLAFVQHELTKGTEVSAGNRLKKAKTPEQAGAVVSEYYERPRDTAKEKLERGLIAKDLHRQHTNNTGKRARVARSNASASSAGVLDSFKSGLTSSNKPSVSRASTVKSGLVPSMSPTPLLKLKMPPVLKQRVDSGGKPPVVMQTSNDTISQNVSDRGLAHAFTGGLGQDRLWG